jgi:glycerol-3-phosphate acyltransferase PlsY
MLLNSILLIVFAYLLGSIPTAYIAGYFIKRVDLRKYGSGTVSGSMVYEHIGRLVVVPVGLFDIAKGAFPTWLAINLGLGECVAVLAGLSAVIGHNWPIYLNFTGGRGLSPYLGLMLVIFPWGSVWLLAFLLVGFLLGDSAPWALAGILTTPILVLLMKGEMEAALAALGMFFVTLIKRVEANRRPINQTDTTILKIIILRILFDRDIIDHKVWIRRTPE